MSGRKFVAVALASLPVALLICGCTLCKARPVEIATAPEPPIMRVADLLPSDAKAGECYVRVFIPERFETVKETVCVREASERLEITPAQYEWVEEEVLIKDASTMLVEVPAEFELQEKTLMVDPGHTGWHMEKTAKCVSQVEQQPAEEMFCKVSHDPVYRSIETNVMVKPVTTKAVPIPAEYQTVRRQKMVKPATTRSIPIPAEYTTIEKTRKVADSRFEWQRVACQPEHRAQGLIDQTQVLATVDCPVPR